VNILLVESYFGGSHRAWAEGYAAHSTHQVDLVTLPARFWKWRMHGGALSLAEQVRASASRPDLVLVSDMVNLPAFLGLGRDVLGDVPVVMYCHENQLTYPCPPGEKRDLTYGVINWLSMVAADRVLFNSQFHLEDWFDELPRLLKHFPDCSHLGAVENVRQKAAVLHVGCDLRRFDDVGARQRAPGDPPVILWNQRWEYDKNPETFFRALQAVIAEGVAFRVVLAGKSQCQNAPEFEQAHARLGERVIHFGHASPTDYVELLCRSDIVVSTAIHEFFGVAVVEAIYSGCFPVLPRRLVYPELVPTVYHRSCLYDSFGGLVELLVWALTHAEDRKRIAKELRPAMVRFDWPKMAPRYDQVFEGMAQA